MDAPLGNDNTTVHVGAAWRVILKDLNLDEVAILRRARLPTTLFEGEGSRITLDELYALHEAVEIEADDPAVALHAGRVVSIELFDPALFAAICSPEMNTAATRLGEFKRLVGPFALDVEVDSELTRIAYRCKHRPDLPSTLGLSELVFLVAFARRATRCHVVPLRVTVQRAPKELAAYTEYFGCPVAESDAWTVVFSAHEARLPFLTHNAGMWDIFEPGLRRRIAEASETRSTRERVEGALLELLPSGRSQLKDVARELGVGPRTLQRRLAAEETSWLSVLADTRERLARHYLRTTKMSPAEVSFLLGFDDPNSLFRAFHRWTGTTPEAWRADVRTTH